jgi:hypothetical protein
MHIVEDRERGMVLIGSYEIAGSLDDERYASCGKHQIYYDAHDALLRTMQCLVGAQMHGSVLFLLSKEADQTTFLREDLFQNLATLQILEK